MMRLLVLRNAVFCHASLARAGVAAAASHRSPARLLCPASKRLAPHRRPARRPFAEARSQVRCPQRRGGQRRRASRALSGDAATPHGQHAGGNMTGLGARVSGGVAASTAASAGRECSAHRTRARTSPAPATAAASASRRSQRRAGALASINGGPPSRCAWGRHRRSTRNRRRVVGGAWRASDTSHGELKLLHRDVHKVAAHCNGAHTRLSVVLASLSRRCLPASLLPGASTVAPAWLEKVRFWPPSS
jgi:hypothetical protein